MEDAQDETADMSIAKKKNVHITNKKDANLEENAGKNTLQTGKKSKKEYIVERDTQIQEDGKTMEAEMRGRIFKGGERHKGDGKRRKNT